MLAHVLYILLVGEHHGWGLNVLSGNTGNHSKKLEVKKGGNRSKDQDVERKRKGGHGEEIEESADGTRDVGRVACMKKDEGADQNANR